MTYSRKVNIILIVKARQPKIKINIKPATRPAMVVPAFDSVRVIVGVGWTGNWKTGNPRRYVQYRDEYGVVRYYTYVDFSVDKKDKGQFAFIVTGFRKVKEITIEKLKQHYEIPNR